MSKIKELLEQLKVETNKELEFCNELDTPHVCAMISTHEGKEKIVETICEYVGNNGMTIGEAINYIEKVSNPNSID